MFDKNDEILDDDFVADFVAETSELLDSIEPDLLEMEKEGDRVSKALLNRVFRAIHSVKGGAGFSGFDTLKELSHTMETVLMQIREGSMQLNASIMDVLLAGVDKIRLMVSDIHASGNVPIGEELEHLTQILNTGTVEVSEPEPSSQFQESAPPAEDIVQEVADAPDNEILENLVGDDLVDDFINDIRDALDSIEPDLLFMEKHSGAISPDLINRVFRAVHSIKGGAGFCGFRALKQISHIMENVLSRIRDAQLTPTPDIVDVLLGGLDKIRIMSNDIQGSESVDYDEEMRLLNQILDRKEDTEESFVEEPPVDDVQIPAEAHQEVVSIKAPEPVVIKSTEKPAPKSSKAPVSETIRVSVDLVDRLMNLAGELVLGRNQLRQAIEELIEDKQKIGPIIQNVDSVTTEIQENIMQMRMQPVGNQLNKFPRTVRDLARQTSKIIELVIEGAEVELDKTILENLSNPLNHLVRNCVDHGIEMPQERVAAGKPECGTIHLRAFHEGGQVNIKISDDGSGIDAEKVAKKAVSNGTLTDDQVKRMSEQEHLNLIFMPGLSTAETVTDISGRGVGMDVVKTNIQQLGGHINIDSKMGEGSTIHIVLPLTLAIIPSLIVGVSQHRFAIPQINVQELVSIKAGDPSHKIEKVGGSDVLRLRGRLLPLVKLTDVLDLKPVFFDSQAGLARIDRRTRLVDRRRSKEKTEVEEALSPEETEKEIAKMRKRKDRRQSWRSDVYVVVLKVGGNIFGLCVDELFDNEEIVVKPLSEHIKDCKSFAGATIMGDGRVAMILDASGIAARARLHFGEINAEERRRKDEEAHRKKTENDNLQSIIVFNNAQDEFFALPLTGISRLEIIDKRKIKQIGNQEFLTYRDSALPLIRLEKYLPIGPLPENPKEIFAIIPNTSRSNIGIITSRILDTIDINVPVQKDATTPRGFRGSAIIEGKLMLFLDTEALLDMFEEEAKTSVWESEEFKTMNHA